MLGILFLLWMLGPRVSFSPTGDLSLPEETPAGLANWIAAAEASIGDIVPGAEKSFTWAGPDVPSRQEYSVVYLHGFSATRQETYPFADLLAAKLGGNAFHTRLAGHGRTDVDALGDVDAQDWYADALEALAIGRHIGRRVVIVGTSTGASLAAVLAENHSAAIHAIVAISPNYGPVNRAGWLTAGPWGRQIGRLVMGEYRSWEPQNDLHRRYWTSRYPSSAIPAMMSLVSYAVAVDHDRLDVPLMTIASPDDTVVDYQEVRRVHDRWGSAFDPPPEKELVLVEDAPDPGHHVIAGDILSPNTTERLASAAAQFVGELTGRR